MNTVNLPKLELLTETLQNGNRFSTHFKSQLLNQQSEISLLKMFLQGDTLHAIAGFGLTLDNSKEALKLLQNRYGNTQQKITAHMNALVKISSVDTKDLSGLRKFFDDFTSHERSLDNLGVESRTYGSLVSPIILEKLSNELRLIISRTNKENNWNFTKILNLINVELKAREACVVPSHTAAELRVRMV